MPLTQPQVQFAAQYKYPPAIKYGEALKTHTCYDAERMKEHEALFEGGKLFQEQLDKDKFLIKRESEKGASGSGTGGVQLDLRLENPEAGKAAQYNPNVGGSTYALRKKYVSYKQRVAGLINFIIAGVLSSAPVIVATKATDQTPRGLFDKLLGFFGVKKNETDPKVQFYHNLNKDADGRGTSLLACKSKLMRDIAVHGRAFAGITFPQPVLQEKDQNALGARDAGAYKGMNTYIPAVEVDDWRSDAGGLCMIRRHFFQMDYSTPVSPPDIKFECWAFITKAGVFTYKIEWKNVDGKFVQPGASDPVPLDDVTPNGLAEMPVRMVDVGIHIMERLRACVIDQINLNCDLRWAIATNVFALVIFFTKEDIDSVSPDTMAMRMMPGDAAQVLSPGPGILASLFQALDRNDDESYETMMALILKSAAQASNGRQSGEAKRMDYNTFETFLMVFSEPLRALLQWQLDTIRTLRGDNDVIVAVQGLDNFDIESVAQILTDADAFLKLPGVPATARKSIILRAFRAVMGSAATPEQLEQVVKEIGADDGAVEPQAPTTLPPAAPPQKVAA